MHGQCACGRWLPRDEMLSINVAAYNPANEVERVRLRLCPACWNERLEALRAIAWDGRLRTEADLRTAGLLPPAPAPVANET